MSNNDECTGQVFRKVCTYDVTVEDPDDEDEDPSIETFPVTVEEGIVFVHV